MSCVVFFYSSRRRHTRLQGDWSSDVCSSDLRPKGSAAAPEGAAAAAPKQEIDPRLKKALDKNKRNAKGLKKHDPARSEERRVGKECTTGGTTSGANGRTAQKEGIGRGDRTRV